MEKLSITNVPVEFDKSDFLSLLSLSAGACVARQKKMGEMVIGENGWNVDVKNRTIKFGEKTFPCGIIGTESELTNTWLWGWANTESNLPEIAFAPARRAKRAFPECEEFTTAKFELDELHSGHNLSMATVGASEKNVCYYRCPYGGGALFVQVEGLPEAVFEPLSLETCAKQFMEIIGTLYCDHKLLAAGLLYQNGYELEEGENYIAAKQGGKTLRVDLESIADLTRATNISLG